MSSLVAGGFALWVAKVGQPSTAVEFAVGGGDLVWLEAVGGWLNNESIEAGDLLRAWVCDPSDDDGVASVPCLQDSEWDVWLRTLASEESSLGSEGRGTERKRGGCAAVNQGVDGVGVVDVVISEHLGGESGGIVGDELGEIVSDHIGIRVAQAESITRLCPGVGGNSGAGKEGNSRGENC